MAASLMLPNTKKLGALSMLGAYLWVLDAPHRIHPASNASGSFPAPGILFTLQKLPKLSLLLQSFAELVKNKVGPSFL